MLAATAMIRQPDPLAILQIVEQIFGWVSVKLGANGFRTEGGKI